MKFVLKILVVAIFVLVVPVLVQAQQHQQLPGIIKNGFKLCQDGMGESVINPKVRIPWSEVLEPSGNQSATVEAKTKSVLAVETVQSVVPIDPVPKASAKSASELVQEKVASKNCPNGWVPSFGECPPEKWDPWFRSTIPNQASRIEHPGVKLDTGTGGKGIVIYKSD